jgi:HSP20 family molecular chaperone IbpA
MRTRAGSKVRIAVHGALAWSLIDRRAGDYPGSVFRLPTAGVFPLVNVTEDQDNYYVRAELPGVKTDEPGISVTGDTLTLSGERKLPEEREKGSDHSGGVDQTRIGF